MSQPDKGPGVQPLTGDAKITVHDHGGVRVAVREVVQPGRNGHGHRYSAELTVLGPKREVAILDARSPEELAVMVKAAVPTFAATVRMRRAAG